MPELGRDAGAMRMNGIREFPESADESVMSNAQPRKIGKPGVIHRRRFRDDKTSAALCPFRVIGHEPIRDLSARRCKLCEH